jgi:hypothetical protein
MGGLPQPIPRDINLRLVVSQLSAGFEEALTGLASPKGPSASVWTTPTAAALADLESEEPLVVEKLGLRDPANANKEAFVVFLDHWGSTPAWGSTSAWLQVVLVGQDAVDRLANCQGLPCPRDLAFHAARLAKLVVVFGNHVLVALRRLQMEAVHAAVYAGIQMGAQLRPRWVELVNPANPRYVLMTWLPERGASE